MRLPQEIFAQTELADILGDEVWPGSEVGTRVGSNTLDDAICKQARTIFHPACTCRMGDSPSALIDEKLCFNGIDGLKVTDCSIMPALFSCNTNVSTLISAGRAAISSFRNKQASA